MAVKNPDNINPFHPKPMVETEKKFVNGSYIDYVDVDEVKSDLPIQFRKNKRFWVNGIELYTPDGENFISQGIQNMSEFFQIV